MTYLEYYVNVYRLFACDWELYGNLLFFLLLWLVTVWLLLLPL